MNLNEHQYKLIVEFSPNLIWRSGTDGLCDYFNKTWLQFTGRDMEQERGNGWVEGVHPDDLSYCLKIYSEAFALRESFEMNYRLKRHDGQWRWINDRGVPFYDDQGSFQGYIGSCVDTTEQVIGEQMKIMAQTDGLTGVFSRQYFIQMAGEEIERSERGQRRLCLAMIDIDRFKAINDEYGHHVGDEVLRHFAQVLLGNVRKNDLAGRYGGDEFIILFPDADLAQASLAMDRLSNKLKSPMILPEQFNLAFTISYGIVEKDSGMTLDSLIRHADKAMYAMKKSK